MKAIERRVQELERRRSDGPARVVLVPVLDVGDGIPRDPQTREPLPEDPDRIVIRPRRGDYASNWATGA